MTGKILMIVSAHLKGKLQDGTVGNTVTAPGWPAMTQGARAMSDLIKIVVAIFASTIVAAWAAWVVAVFIYVLQRLT